ncbi:hypothetical protein CC1G_00243 [Coprinopsis cinerea okayama7|uniref:Uncharacterized protein n=1 Tax=Coprinopsis cinerea (strain Okayama-7 / 130 / ATCC MYA-4618 / FGSC 9003) TaxID=240176 RepID=A8NX98_COPC7|nr:hypothetical protein CC1G_00243 [Coprinopsis cinerea okayama7\|eukprot:XP_001837107.2 hypothetical protein CC1G_00243 [Coprinopsis cinerea okayama7\
MTTYYPSQAGYAQTQPVMYANSGYAPTAGYPQPVYGQPAGVMYVPSSSYSYPSYGGHHHRRRRSRRSWRWPWQYGQTPYVSSSYYSGVPQVMSTAMPVQAAPVMQMRIRLFFGLAPTPSFKYRSDKNSWGFMGYSRRQRFIDPRTGGEVDRHGRPVIRV